MERFYLRSELVDAKDGVARRGSLYRVEDVISRDGRLMTKSGVFLSPLITPTPAPTATPGAPDFLPDIEPAPLPEPSPSDANRASALGDRTRSAPSADIAARCP